MKIPFSHPAWIEINCQKFKKNIQSIKKSIQKSKLCIPVKANAYGHGLIPMAKYAESYGADYLAVSCLQEGLLLRQAQIKIPILVLGAIHENQIQELIQSNLEFTIASKHKADLLLKELQNINQTCKIHIEIETGMQRTGLRIESAQKLILQLQNYKNIEIVGIYSHLATSDSPNNAFAQNQIHEFTNFIQIIRAQTNLKFIAHIANSGGVCHYPQSHLDMVRPGLLAFGYGPQQLTGPLKNIVPFFSLKAKVSYFKVVQKNLGISYGHSYKTQNQTRVVTIPVGYGDGYKRMLSNKGQVLIHGKKYTISGTICMDQFMVDIGNDSCYISDEVVLVGEQNNEKIPVEKIAELCQTIPYEILCSFNERIPRIYIENVNL